MFPLRRRKRDTVENIYRNCRQFGTCPPDVVNRVENSTTADKILQYGSSGVFLGGLGIGTGTGPAVEGALGGVGGEAVLPAVPERPGITIGAPPREPPILPPRFPEAIEPEAPVLPPRFPEAVDPSVIAPPRFPEAIEPLEEVGRIDLPGSSFDVSSEIPGRSVPSHPPISTENGPDTTSAVLEVTTTQVSSRTQYNNPAFEYTFTPNSSGEVTLSDQVYSVGGGGRVVGGPSGESIPLREFSTGTRSTEISETSFTEGAQRSSTPNTVVPRMRPFRLWPRQGVNVEVTDPRFLTQPEVLVQFDNPAFEADADVSLIFERDLRNLPDVLAAPDPDFQDVVRLSRPIFSQSTDGLVRVSRVGKKASITTRSGLRIGPRTHYFFDISPIRAAEEGFELLPIGEHSTDAVDIIDPSGNIAESAFEEVSLSSSALEEPYPDSFLLDVGERWPTNMELTFGRRSTLVPQPDLATVRKPPFLTSDGTYVGSHVPPDTIISGGGDSPPVTPLFDTTGPDFYLHPSLRRRRRRRRRGR